MFIQLQEIPNEGKSWTFNRKTAELNEDLKSLVGQKDYSVELHITPLTAGSNSFDVRGVVKTELPEDCSRCGLDFQYEIHEKFQNLLMPQLETPRDGKFAKPNHYSDLHEEGPEVAEYTGNTFNVGEFIHEIIALAEPPIPAPACDAEGNCSLCKISVKDRSFSYDSEKIEPVHPFASLKGIKIN